MLILSYERPDLGLRLMDKYGLLKAVLPEVWAMKGVAQPPQFHPEGDVYTHTLLMLSMMKKPFSRRPEFALAVLLHDVGKPVTFEVADRIRFNNHAPRGVEIANEMLRRLRFPNEMIKTVGELIRDHLKFMEVSKMRASTLKRFLRQDHFDLHLELHRLDCLGSHGDLDNFRLVRAKLRELRSEKIPLRPPRLLTGNDLIRSGLTPGPQFSVILTALEDAQLEGTVKTREEALEWLRKYLLCSL